MHAITRILFISSITLLFSACATKTNSHKWEHIKGAAYNAAVDPMTWIPFATGLALDATGLDDDLTNHIIDDYEEAFFTEDNADDFRTMTSLIAYSTALAVPDENLSLKTKRVLVGAFALEAGRVSVTIMNDLIDKEYPRPIPGENDAIGSQHAVAPFLASALTLKNLERIDIMPDWGKYAIATTSYVVATESTYQRIQSGLHSVSDQLYSVMVGNFLALFIHDTYLTDNLNLHIQLLPERSKIVLDIPL